MVVYTNNDNGKFSAICFAGKAVNPTWYYLFRSEEAMLAQVAKTVNNRIARAAEVAKYKAPELYKLFLQSKVAIEKSKQKEADKKEKKEANKKARAEAKLRKRYVGSVTIKIRYTDIKKFSIIKVKTLPIDIIVNPSNLKAQIKNIIDDYINEQMDNTLGYSINGNKIMDIRYYLILKILK